MIRINELARELEVKPKAILDLLPDLGVSEKKTHSSSIEADVAVIVKQKLLAEAAVEKTKRGRGIQSPGLRIQLSMRRAPPVMMSLAKRLRR